MDRRIGILVNGGKAIYYAFLHGYHKPEFRGTLEEVERALGIEPTPPAPAPAPKKNRAREYIVKVTPRIVSHTGTFYDGPYEVEITAESHAKAITKARAARFDEEGRFGVRCDYSAKLKAER